MKEKEENGKGEDEKGVEKVQELEVSGKGRS